MTSTPTIKSYPPDIGKLSRVKGGVAGLLPWALALSGIMTSINWHRIMAPGLILIRILRLMVAMVLPTSVIIDMSRESGPEAFPRRAK